MSVDRTRRRALWVVPETTYATDPGSGYVAVPAMSLGDISDGRSVIETNRFTGRTGVTEMIPGPDSATFSFELEALGLATQAGDGDSPVAEDYLDQLLQGALGTLRELDGIAVDSHSGTSLSVASDAFDVGDLLPIVDSGGVIRYRAVTVDSGGGDYTLDSDPATTGTVVRGVRLLRDDEGTDTTDTFTFVYDQDGTQYTLVGCRITSLSLNIQPDQQARFSFEVFADSYSVTAKTGLATQTGTTATTPLRRARVYVDGTELDSASVEVDFGLDAQPRASTALENGRSDHLLVSAQPTITMVPVFASAELNLKRNQTVRRVLVQLGETGPSLALQAERAQVAEASLQDANGLQRISLQFRVIDAGATGQRWQVGRA